MSVGGEGSKIFGITSGPFQLRRERESEETIEVFDSAATAESFKYTPSASYY